MAQTLKVETLQMRNDTAANWNSKNPVLAKGEMGVEIDTKKFKFGDGITKWQELSYASSNEYDLPTATTSTLGGVKSQAAGTDKVVVASDGTMSVSEVTAATKLKTARSITLSGDVSGSASFDGSAAVAIQANLGNSGVTAGTYTKVTVDAKGRVTTATNLSESDIPNLSTSKITGIGTAATKNVGSAAGNVPMLNESGKLDESILPALAITEPHVVDNEEEMLALEAQTGDVAVRKEQRLPPVVQPDRRRRHHRGREEFPGLQATENQCFPSDRIHSLTDVPELTGQGLGNRKNRKTHTRGYGNKLKYVFPHFLMQRLTSTDKA